MAALLMALPLATQAAGLGKINIISALGQPLNAEIEIVSLQAGEEEGLVARVAPEEAFARAGIEMTAVLSDLRFSIEKRGAATILKLRSITPVNEPFLELLIELAWSNGRLVREYTFLLDPPDYKNRMAIAAQQPAAEPKPEAKPEAKPEP